MIRVARWGATLAALLLLLLYVANLPFYAGSSIGPRFTWRMEHGRLALEASTAPRRESFYIAPNSEGLHFVPEWRVNSLSDWRINIPLWIPLIALIAIAIAAWRITLRRRAAGRCRKCRYPRAGLAPGAPCPECGTPATDDAHPVPVRSDSPPL